MIENYRSGFVWQRDAHAIRTSGAAWSAPASPAAGSTAGAAATPAAARAGQADRAMRALLRGCCAAGAARLAGCGCARADDGRDSRRASGRWAARARSSPQLLPEFERAHPGIRVDAAAAAVDRGARKAADRVRRRRDCRTSASSATPGCRSSPRSTRSSRSTRASPRRRRSMSRDYFPGIWDTNVVDGQLYGVPWYVDTRLPVLPPRPAGRRRAIAAPPRDWDEWTTMRWRRSSATPGRTATRSCCRSTSSSRCWRSRCSRTSRCCATADAAATSAARASGARWRSTWRCSTSGCAPPIDATTQISNVWDEFGRGFFAFYISGPWNIGEFKRRLPAERAGRAG